MILTALKALAEREGLVKVPDYEPAPVRFVVTLGPNGEFRGLQDTLIRVGTDRRVAHFFVPKRSTRTSGDQSEFVIDKAEYVFGWPERPDKPKDLAKVKKRAQERHNLYIGDVRRATSSEACGRDEGMIALAKFLGWPEQHLALDTYVKTNGIDWQDGDMWTFLLDTDPEGPRLVTDSLAVQQYWHTARQDRDDPVPQEESKRRRMGGGMKTRSTGKPGPAQQPSASPSVVQFHCLVTNEPCRPIRLHPPISGVPPTKDTGRGAPLTSVDKDSEAFSSYGLQAIACAPVSRLAADRYQSALQRLLDPEYPNPVDGTPMPRRFCSLSANTAIVFWAKTATPVEDLFSDAAFDADPEAIAALFSSPWWGWSLKLDESDVNRFYALTVSGAKGRTTIRDWSERPIKSVFDNLAQYFEDINLSPPPGQSHRPVPLRRMLPLLAQGRDSAKRRENMPAHIVASVFHAILSNKPFPWAVLVAAVQRTRVEKVPGDKKLRGEFLVAEPDRFALIKACLLRARRAGLLSHSFPEVKPMVDENCKESAYRLGRLFAVLEKVQQEAVNAEATIRDRYYGAASATPSVVFPQLVRKYTHHLKKCSRPVFYEKLVQEIHHGMIPNWLCAPPLTIPQQGLFAVGYYHESRALFDSAKIADRNARFFPNKSESTTTEEN